MIRIKKIPDEIQLSKEEVSEYINIDWAIASKSMNLLRDKVNELVDAVNILKSDIRHHTAWHK
jgi:hypothetical protein